MVSEGTLISAAKWLVNTEPLREEQKKERITVDWHPDDDSNDWAEHLINWIHQHQIRRTEGKPCVSTYHFLPVLVPPSPFHPHLLHTLTRNFPHSPRHPINTPFTPKTRCWLPLDAVRYSNRRFPQFTSVYWRYSDCQTSIWESWVYGDSKSIYRGWGAGEVEREAKDWVFLLWETQTWGKGVMWHGRTVRGGVQEENCEPRSV